MIDLAIEKSCIRCGQCVSICPAHILQQTNKKAKVTIQNMNSCIECGHCVAICPTDSVIHSVFPLEKVHPINKEILPPVDAVLEVLRKRRSNRAMSENVIPNEFLEKILEAAHLAPTARNQQALSYTLITNTEVLKSVTKNIIKIVDHLIETLGSSANQRQMAYMSSLSKSYKKGQDVILRKGTALLLIHSTENCAADANIAYQNASIIAECLGVAHFYAGFVCVFSAQDKERLIQRSLGFEGTILAGMVLGMPQYTFSKYIDKNPQIVNRI